MTVKITSKNQIFEVTATVLLLPSDDGYGDRFSRSKATLPFNAEGLVAPIVRRAESNLKLSNPIPLGTLMNQTTRSPRIPFIAVAEIFYRESGGRLSVHVSTVKYYPFEQCEK